MEESGADGVEALVLNCNKLAMDHLRVEQFDEAFNLLRRAEEMLRYPDDTPGKLRLLAITLNNLGCFYKRSSKPNVALKYLQQALEIEVKTSNDRTNVAGTHLNICAIKSQLNKHESALQHAKQALFLLSSPGFEFTPNSVTTLAIAYHNAGVEYEFLTETGEAAKAYHSGWELAKQHLGTSHPLTHSLEKSYRNVTEVKLGKVAGNVLESSTDYPVKPKKGRKSSQKESTRGLKSPRVNGDTVLPLIRRNTTSSNKRKNSGSSDSTPMRKSVGLRSSSPMENSATPQHSKRAAAVSMTPTERTRPPLRTPNSDGKRALDPLIPKPPAKPNNYPIRRKDQPPGTARTSPRTVLNIVTATKKQAAAVRIQKHWRGHVVRKLLQEEKLARKLISRKDAERIAHEAITELEKLKKQVKEESKKPLIAPPIPAPPKDPNPQKKTPFKVKASRLAPIPEAKTESNAGRITLIQAHIRGFLAKRQFGRVKRAVVTIQKHMRRHQVRRLYQSIRDAIIFIQTVWREQKRKRRA